VLWDAKSHFLPPNPPNPPDPFAVLAPDSASWDAKPRLFFLFAVPGAACKCIPGNGKLVKKVPSDKSLITRAGIRRFHSGSFYMIIIGWRTIYETIFFAIALEGLSSYNTWRCIGLPFFLLSNPLLNPPCRVLSHLASWLPDSSCVLAFGKVELLKH
jgi:hypothetical protein